MSLSTLPASFNRTTADLKTSGVPSLSTIVVAGLPRALPGLPRGCSSPLRDGLPRGLPGGLPRGFPDGVWLGVPGVPGGLPGGLPVPGGLPRRAPVTMPRQYFQ